MNKHLFLIIPNNCGSTILYKALMHSKHIVGLTNRAGNPDEGEKIIFHEFREVEKSPMPVPIYWEPHNPRANPLIHGLGRIWGSIDHSKVFGNEDYFDWNRIKDVWNKNWKRSPKYTDNAILMEKSPTSPAWAGMLSKHFENAYFIISMRHPYAVCEGIRRRIWQNQRHVLSMENCIIHWIETARLQILNLKNFRGKKLKVNKYRKKTKKGPQFGEWIQK